MVIFCSQQRYVTARLTSTSTRTCIHQYFLKKVFNVRTAKHLYRKLFLLHHRRLGIINMLEKLDYVSYATTLSKHVSCNG